jgi:hypothetical protein
MSLKNIQKTNDRFNDFLKNKNVAFYGYKKQPEHDFVSQKKEGSVKKFLKNDSDTSANEKIQTEKYKSLYEISEHESEIYFLDNNASKVLFARFPIYAHYVLLRMVPRSSWLIAIPGLLRRWLLRRSVKLHGIIKLKNGKKTERWLLIENLKIMPRPEKYAKFSLSLDIGVMGLLQFLEKEKIKYVVLRFYDKLPKLDREDGDLDILVEDSDVDKVEEFLSKSPGPITVEIKPTSLPVGTGIPYYVPHLAQKILQSAVKGPAGALIPGPKEAFLSFTYHVLYHKGLEAGVPTKIPGLKREIPPSDYVKEISKLAKNIDLDIPITMEDLEEYLYKEGWRPKLDTLAKIAIENEWVRKRLSENEKKDNDIGLGVMILKEGVFKANKTDPILNSIADRNGFKIVKTKRFTDDKKYIAEHLRGGVWVDELTKAEDYQPAMAIIVCDLYCANGAKVNTADMESGKRIKTLKEQLRKEFGFDKTGMNFIHGTDNTGEAWEYIEVCFKNEVEQIQNEIRHIYKNIRLPLIQRTFLRIKFKSHYLLKHFRNKLNRFKQTMSSRAVRKLLG